MESLPRPRLSAPVVVRTRPLPLVHRAAVKPASSIVPTRPLAAATGTVAPRTIGNYRLDEVLGEGGMGTVYRGSHTLIERDVAIKLLNHELGGDATQVRRFLDEARALSTVHGPDVVELLDCGVLGDGRPYLVMELLRGQTLGQRLRDRGALPVVEALAIGRAIAAALVAVHGHGIVHRDLKPDNVFLTGDAWAAIKLLDFGIAKAPCSAAADRGLLLGTPAYMAPEQYDDPPAVDGRTDLYALGCLLFEMLTGAPPFPERCPLQLLVARAVAVAPRVRARAPAVAPAVEALVASLLARDPGDRPASAAAVTAHLDALLAGGGDGRGLDDDATAPWTFAAEDNEATDVMIVAA